MEWQLSGKNFWLAPPWAIHRVRNNYYAFENGRLVGTYPSFRAAARACERLAAARALARELDEQELQRREGLRAFRAGLLERLARQQGR